MSLESEYTILRISHDDILKQYDTQAQIVISDQGGDSSESIRIFPYKANPDVHQLVCDCIAAHRGEVLDPDEEVILVEPVEGESNGLRLIPGAKIEIFDSDLKVSGYLPMTPETVYVIGHPITEIVTSESGLVEQPVHQVNEFTAEEELTSQEKTQSFVVFDFLVLRNGQHGSYPETPGATSPLIGQC